MTPDIATAVLDGLADGVLVFDADRICAYANASAARLLGASAATLIGHPIHTVLRRDALERACGRVAATRTSEMLDDEAGDGRCHRFRIVPWDAGVVIFLRDRDEPAQDLTPPHSPGLLQQVADFAPVGITLADLTGRLRLVNRFASTWVGQPSRAVLGNELADYVSPELAERVSAAEARVRASGRPELVTAWSSPVRGDPVRLEIAVFAVFDAAGELTGTGAVYNDVTAHANAERALSAAAEERRHLLNRLVDAQEHERARIAADIHDDSIQALAAVALRLTILERTLDGAAAEVVKAVHDSLSKAMDRLRTLLFDLEPAGTEVSLATGIREAAQFVLDPVGIAWQGPGEDIDLPITERIIAVRIAKEALANVRAHASAQHVTITTRRHEGGVEVAIADDGVGPGEARSQPGHRGVTTMQDRATLAGGWLQIEGGDPRGTTVRYWLPTLL